MAKRVGDQLGNYHLLKLVGEDGFAEHYLAEHRKSRTLAVIKVLYTQLVGKDVERFLSEAAPIVNVMHPHILRVLEFGVEEGTPFLVVEYAPHGNLRQRHPKGTQLPLSTIISYVKQAANGLKYAHDRNLIHRDVKPENMQLGRHDEVLLSDLSTALIIQSSNSAGNPEHPEVAGTILYMAPEQIEGKPCPASDQYALGVVIYEWLSGICPFTGSFSEIAIQHLMRPLPSLHEILPTISSELEQVVMTALAKDPKQRFGTVSAFANALSQVSQADMTQPFVPSYATKPLSSSQAGPVTPLIGTSTVPTASTGLMTPPLGGPFLSEASPLASPVAPVAGTPVTLSTASISEQPTERGRVVSRRKVVAGFVGVGLVAAAGGLAWQTLHLLGSRSSLTAATTASTPTTKSTPPSKPPIAPGSVVLRTPVFPYRGHTNLVQTVAWSPDGKLIASGSFDATVQLWDPITGRNLLVYRGHAYNLRSVKWSPNGKLIASGSDDQTAQVWDPVTGHTITIYKGHYGKGNVTSVAWSPDSIRVASASGDTTIQVWEAATGKLLVTYYGHSDRVRRVAWSHDGTRIVSGCDDTDAHVWEATTGKLLLIYGGHSSAVHGLAWSPDDKGIASASWDMTAQVWDSKTGQIFLTYRGHTDQVWTLAWAPDGKHIVSGGPDRTAQLWEAGTGKAIITYQGHKDAVVNLDWSPNSQFVVSGSADKTAQVWKATLS